MKTNEYHEPCAEDEWIEISRKLHEIESAKESPEEWVNGTKIFAFIIWPMIMLLGLPVFLLIGGVAFIKAIKMGIGLCVIALIASTVAYFVIGEK